MEYHAPFGSTDPDASYVDRNTPGAVSGSKVPGLAIELPQREIVNVITKCGLTPDDADHLQLTKAIRSMHLNSGLVAGGTANALAVPLDPAPASLAELVNVPFFIIVSAANTSATVTVQFAGLTPVEMKRRNSATLAPGDLRPGIALVMYDGTYVRLLMAPWGASNRNNPGSVDLPGGMTLQWGTGSTTSGHATVLFDKAFDGAPYSVQAIDNGAGSWSTSNASFLGYSSANASGVTFQSVTWNGLGTGMIRTTTLFAYFAIGKTL